ncbi:MAG TPA: zinc-binding dehydrogenase [Dehalococcoidia bacterium]|nr:zinc-binding dehydrogenase [Dehalococcoidia bacterium]
MRAVVAARVGGDEPLANLDISDVPEPDPPAGWAVVRVAVASLNHHDIWTLRGVSAAPVEPPQVLGTDGAGFVERYGEGTTVGDWPAPGTRVLIFPVVTCGHCVACLSDEADSCRDLRTLSEPPMPGTFAERVAIPAANLIPLPDSVDFGAAACLPTAYLTAYRMLFHRARLRPGMSVLVHGAGGGVASAAIILARLGGCTVYATSRDEAKRQFALDLGAEDVFPPVRESGRAIIAATGGRGVDAVIETVGEPTWALSLVAVRPGGTVVVSGATGGADPPAQLRRIFFRRIQVSGTSMGSRGELRRLVELCATGALQPLISGRHPFDQAREAFAEMARGDVRGKILIDI